MNEKYAVIVDNGGGPNLEYHDVEGQEYTFRFNNVLEEGTKVIYYRSGETPENKHLKRLMKVAHYFGTATIGKVCQSADGNYRATILDYEQFKYGVPFNKGDGTNWENIGNYQWTQVSQVRISPPAWLYNYRKRTWPLDYSGR